MPHLPEATPFPPFEVRRQQTLGLEAEALKRAKAGAAFFDFHYGHPFWRDKVNRDTLDIANSNNCMCGQLNFVDWNSIRAYLPSNDHTHQMATLGFIVGDGGLVTYTQLTKAWLQVLAEPVKEPEPELTTV